jgi:exodeoxyribonuclease-5
MNGYRGDEEGGGDESGDRKSKQRSQHAGRPKFTAENLYRTMGPTAGSDRDTQVDVVTGAAPVFTRDVLSPDQVTVYEAVLAWYKDTNRRQDLKFGGLAGTGKTTLVSVLATELLKQQVSVVFGAFTGKAANVLNRKLKASKIGADCKTLHSLLYKPIVHDHENASAASCKGGAKCPKLGRIERWQLRTEIEAGLVVVDEASMVNKDLWEDLLSFGVPVLAVGDHGQLPPIGSGKDNVNLMAKPDLVLEKIHRQAAGNPILALAHHVRAGRSLREFNPTDDRVTFGQQFMSVLEGVIARIYAQVPTASEGPFGLQPFYNLLLNQVIICGKNATRTTINRLYRRLLEYQGDAPDPGDVVIALKNFKPVFNGMRGVFEGADYGYETNEYGAFMGTVLFPDDGLRVRGDLSYPQFGREKTFEHPRDVPHPATVTDAASKWDETGLLFDYGYALTCHKAQGSQWSDVVVCAYDAFGNADDRKRWLYTACTRASERLIVVP